MGKGLIKIIDLEINHVAICFKRPKVVFAIRVVADLFASPFLRLG